MLFLFMLWLFQTVFLTDMYKLVRTMEMEKAINLVETSIDDEDLDIIILGLEQHMEILVRPTSQYRQPPEQVLLNPKFTQPEAITRTKMFTKEDGTVLSMTFYAVITPVNATVSTLQLQMFMIVCIMILFAVVLAMIIASHIAKPIERLNQSAKVLATGQYDVQFQGRGFLEIKELSDTLNTAAEELSKVETLRRELLANVSHDLRTPLALIYSYAEMMHDFPREITSEQTQTIMNEAQRLTKLVGDVLDLASLESGTMELCKGTYNLTQSLRSSVERTGELVKHDGFTISMEADEDAYVRADEIKITQAFYNLLLNAIHYSNEEKHITIRQSVQDGYVTIAVIDQGAGILEDYLPYIWDRYYKVGKQRRHVTGTGLGLSIVRKILELHDGRYGVVTALGLGSTFWFSLEQADM